MQKTLIGKTDSYTFEPVILEDQEIKADDLGILYHGKSVNSNKSVVIRHIQDTKLIKSPQHLQLIQNIYQSLNLLHTGIVQTYDCIYSEDGIFIVREQLNGIDLQQVAFTGDYPHLRNAQFILTVAQKVCEILSVLHKNKIIHRRIQSSNIFICTNELGQIDIDNPKIKLINFEYAQINGQNIFAFPSIPYALYYSAPELVLQCNLLVNASCDLYSLGISIYEAFAREHVFVCDNEDKNLILNMQLSFPIKRHHRIPKYIFPLIQKATAKHIFQSPPQRYKPEARLKFFFNAQKRRFQSTDEMSNALSELLTKIQTDRSQNIVMKIKSWFSKSK